MKRWLAALAIGAVLGTAAAAWQHARDPGSAVGFSALSALESEEEEYDLTEIDLYRRAVDKVNNEFLDPARVSPEKMLIGSLESVARLIPEFVFVRTEGRLRLYMDREQKDLVLPQLESAVSLAEAMGQVATFLAPLLPASLRESPIEVEYAMLHGTLGTLDPHSVFMEPSNHEEWATTAMGHFGGLGITIGVRDDALTILYPLQGTPASRAGLKAGDRIRQIDGLSTVNMELEEAVSRLRGDAGKRVTILIEREAEEDREYTLTRARIDVPSVRWAYAGDGVGFIRIYTFNAETTHQVDTALTEMIAEANGEGRGALRGVILDLRHNPGGFLQRAVEVADKFLNSGVIVTTSGLHDQQLEEVKANALGTERDVGVVVLVDSQSASASEIVAGALKNQDRAVILGTRTFGKGSVQNLYDHEFGDGALKLTIAQYKTPGNQSIQGVGIEPDIELRAARVEKEDDGSPRVDLYWEDETFREEDFQNSFKFDAARQGAGQLAWIYDCKTCWATPAGRDKEESAKDHLTDLEVRAAKELLTRAASPNRQTMLKGARAVLSPLLAPEEEKLVSNLRELGIDWSPAPAQRAVGTPRFETSMTIVSPDGKLEPGQPTAVSLTVTNRGTAPIYRLRGVTQAETFDGREFVFGKVAPGESRTFTVKARPSLSMPALTDEVTWMWRGDGGPTPPPFIGRLEVRDIPKPRFGFSWQLIDDGSGRSRGNGDGLIQAGEEIELLVRVKNLGDGPTSDIWKKERGLSEADVNGQGPAEDGEPALPSSPDHRTGESPQVGDPEAAAIKPKKDRKGGQIILKNPRDHAPLFIVQGSEQFSLARGGQWSGRLLFRLNKDVPAGIAEAELYVLDDKFGSMVESTLKLPIQTAVDTLTPIDKVMKGRSGVVSLRGAASDVAPIVGRSDGAFAVDGQFGGWFRVPLPSGGHGFVLASEVSAAGRNETVALAVETLAFAPPVVQVDDQIAGMVSVGDKLHLRGVIRDDGVVKDVSVYVRGPAPDPARKVAYMRLGAKGEAPLDLEIQLMDGANTVEIVARDEADLQGFVSFGVYRERTTAASDRPATAVVR